MSGLSDYTARNLLNYVTGQIPQPLLPAAWLALMTAVDTDGGTGGTEVSGLGYSRVQVSGTLTAGASFTTSISNITLSATAPAWLLALGTNGSGVSVYDLTAGAFVGTVSTISGTSVTLTANASHASSGASDSLVFSAFGNATGSAPSQVVNGATITFPQANANWGTIVAFELRDAVTAGNLLLWDYIGNFAWLPATISAASPGVFTAPAHGYSNGDSFVYSIEYGGTAPTFSAGNYTGIQTVAGATTNTFDVTGVNTSATGNGMVRKVAQQQIPQNIITTFAVNSFVVTAA